MPARKSGLGNSTSRKVISALQASLSSQRISALVTAKPEPSCTSLAESASVCPGVTNERSLTSFNAQMIGMRTNFVAPITSQPEVCAMASMSRTPGISG